MLCSNWHRLVATALVWSDWYGLVQDWNDLDQNGIAQFRLVWFGSVWYGLVQFGMFWFSLVWFGSLVWSGQTVFVSVQADIV
jgi:hypothetical protein